MRDVLGHIIAGLPEQVEKIQAQIQNQKITIDVNQKTFLKKRLQVWIQTLQQETRKLRSLEKLDFDQMMKLDLETHQLKLAELALIMLETQSISSISDIDQKWLSLFLGQN